MAIADLQAKSTEQIKKEELFVANTTNVKEMKNGRPMNVKIKAAGLANCTIITLGAIEPDEVGEHVYAAVPLAPSAVPAAVQAGKAYVVVAPEIMVEQARKTDGHIGKFRLENGEVYTAYQLSVHDRLELSAHHPFVGAGTVVSRRTMANGAIIKPAGGLYSEAQVEMVKIEFPEAE